jgi:hypothetical protein
MGGPMMGRGGMGGPQREMKDDGKRKGRDRDEDEDEDN